MQKFNLVLLVAAALNVACGGAKGSSLELKLDGTMAGKLIKVDGPWRLEAGDGVLLYTSGASGPNYISEGGGVVSRFVLRSGGDVLTVGKDAFHATVSIEGAEVILPSTVERIRFTSDPESTLEFTGTIGGGPSTTIGNAANALTSEGKFTMYSTCNTKGLSSGHFDYCGSSASYLNGKSESTLVPQSGTFVTERRDAQSCPTEVAAVFIDGLNYRYTVSSMKVGKAKALDCIKLNNGDKRMCGSSESGVKADGCTWTVDASSSPIDRFIVRATADASCTRAAGRFCRTGWY